MDSGQFFNSKINLLAADKSEKHNPPAFHLRKFVFFSHIKKNGCRAHDSIPSFAHQFYQ
jgi:hypothetical protein